MAGLDLRPSGRGRALGEAAPSRCGASQPCRRRRDGGIPHQRYQALLHKSELPAGAIEECPTLLLLLVPLQLGLLGFEAVAGLALVRRWSFVKRAYWDALVDCWRLRKHILAERRRIRQFRRRGDLWMLRFLRWRLNRWDEVQRLRRFGVPKVTDTSR